MLNKEAGVIDEAAMMAELEAMGGEEFKFDAVAKAEELTQQINQCKA